MDHSRLTRILATVLAFCILIIILPSCRTQKPMVQTQIIHDTIHDTSGIMTHRHDSISIRDSIVTIIRGDTVTIDRWHTRDRIQLRVDTVERIRTVTKLRTETQTVTVTEYRLSWHHKLWLWTATILALISTAYIAIRRYIS